MPCVLPGAGGVFPLDGGVLSRDAKPNLSYPDPGAGCSADTAAHAVANALAASSASKGGS